MAISIGELEAVLKLKDEMSGQLNEAAKSTGLFGSMFEGTMGKAMAVGAGVSAVIVAMEATLISLGNRGSDVNDVAGALDSFTGSAEASNDILEKMKAGTLGTVDSFTLMKESSRLLGAGVDLNAEQFGELSQAAFALQNRGLGPTKDMLALVSDAMITGKTKAIAMKLGVVDVGDAEIAYANKLGKTKDALKDSEKTEAKRIVVMSLLEKAVKQAGEAHRDFGEELEAASAFVTDFVDDIAKGIAASPALSDAVNRISKALSDAFGDDRSGAIETVISALEGLATITADVVVFIIKITDEIINFTKFIAENLTILGLITVALVAFASGLGIISIGALAAAAATSIATIATAAFAATMAVLTGPVLLVIAGIAALIAAYKYFGNSTEDASAAAADQAKKLEQNAAASKIAEEATEKLAKQKEADTKASEKQAAAELAHQEALKASKKIREEQAAALITLRGYTKSYEETLKTIDPVERKQIENHIANGAGLGLLAKAYPKLTEAQIESINKGIEAEKKRVETIAKVTEDVATLQQNAADAIEALDADTLANRINHLDAKRQRETKAASQSIADAMAVGFTLQEVQTKQVEAILAIEKKYIALGTAEQRKAADEKNKIVLAGLTLYLDIVKTNADAAFNLTATDREKSLRAIQQNEKAQLEEVRKNTLEGSKLRQKAEDEVRKGSAASVAALSIDNAALTANSKKQLQETALIAKNTYNAMQAHPQNFTKATMKAFKEAAEAAEDAATETTHNWKDAFTNIGAGVTNILIDAFTKGGGIVAAAKGVAVLAGAEIGKTIGKMTESFGKMAGPIGAVVGSLAGPLTEGMINLFTRGSRAREELKKIGEEANTLHKKFVEMNKGIGDVDARAKELGFSMNWAAKSKADIQALNNQMEEFTRRLDQMKEASGKITVGFAAVTQELTSGFGKIGTAVRDTQAELVEAEKSYNALSESGEASSEELVKAQQRIADAVMAVVGAQVNQAAAATNAEQILKDLGTQGVATFASVLLATGSYSEALKAVGPTLGKLQQAYTDLGLNVEDVALKHLMVQSTVAAANPSLMAAIDAQKGALQGMAQMGLLNVETFAAMQRTGMELFNRLNAKVIESGGDIRDALMPMQSYLQQAALQAKLLGLPLDANTQKLIDQSQKLGIWKEAGQTANDLLIAGMTELVAKVGQLLDKLFETKDVLGKLPSPTITITRNDHTNYTQSGRNTEEFAHGGIVRGYATGIDSVPAMLTPGEAVLTVAATRSLGAESINRLNAGGSLNNTDAIINELRLLRKQQATSDRQLPLLVAISVRDAMQLQR